MSVFCRLTRPLKGPAVHVVSLCSWLRPASWVRKTLHYNRAMDPAGLNQHLFVSDSRFKEIDHRLDTFEQTLQTVLDRTAHLQPERSGVYNSVNISPPVGAVLPLSVVNMTAHIRYGGDPSGCRGFLTQIGICFELNPQEMNRYRSWCGLLFGYDWVGIPLVYTQVVTLAVYTFFVACLIGRQFLDPKQEYAGHDLDLYVPVFTLLQFFFYAGWLKVAEQLINPFGEDDDDFETNWCIDRNLQVSLMAVDEMHMNLPKMSKDIYWNESDARPPYTLAAADYCIPSFLGSTVHMGLPDSVFLREDWMVEEEKNRRQNSVVRRVKRFLSFHEHPDSPSRTHSRTPSRSGFSRQGSDASNMFFPCTDTNYVGSCHEVPHRGRSHFIQSRRRVSSDKNSLAPTPLDNLSTIREASRSDISDRQTSSEGNMTPNSALTVPEVVVTTSDGTRPTSQYNIPLQSNQTCTTHTSDCTEKQPNSPDVIADNGASGQIASQESQVEEQLTTDKEKQQPATKDQPKTFHRWSDSLHPSQHSGACSQPKRMSLQTFPLELTMDNTKSIPGNGNVPIQNLPSEEELISLLQHIDAKETDIVEFSDEKKGDL